MRLGHFGLDRVIARLDPSLDQPSDGEAIGRAAPGLTGADGVVDRLLRMVAPRADEQRGAISEGTDSLGLVGYRSESGAPRGRMVGQHATAIGARADAEKSIVLRPRR